MKRISILGLILCACLVSAAWAQDSRALAQANSPFANVVIRNSDRTVLHDNIVHYRYTVAVGPGKFDVIRVHRVVRERNPHHPIRTISGVILLPGSPNYFEAIFMEPLISQVPAWDDSIAVFLAKNNIDVWGMDYAWALVPAETTDFNFMKDWGVVKDSQHTEIALWLARWIRGSTGQGFDQLHLLGFSYGGIIGYSVAGHETQQPDFLRNVKGIIVGDVAMKFEEKSISDYYCNAAAADQGNLNAGVYNDDTGVFLKQLSDLALSAPDDPSPIFAGLTNYQASLFLGTSTWLLDGNPIFWHFVAGAGELFADPFWIPSDLQYTKVRLWVDLLRAIPPHLPVQSDFDVHAEFCGTLEVPFDNHLRQIAVPILYVGAAGGFGRTGYYTTTLTASRDITRFTVQFLPDDRRALDFGHADLFTATNAETLVWKPILDWIVAHR